MDCLLDRKPLLRVPAPGRPAITALAGDSGIDSCKGVPVGYGIVRAES